MDEGHLIMMRMGRGGGAFTSNLMFAYDLLFGEATSTQRQCVNVVMDSFASSQGNK